MPRFRLKVFVAGLMLVAPSLGSAEEAVASSGKIHRGSLHFAQGAWTFRGERGAAIQLRELSYIHFERKSAPPPAAPVVHTLRLAGDQRISGTFLRLDAKQLAFITSWGQAVTVDRSSLRGIEPADDSLVILRDDFEPALKGWTVEGKSTLSPERAFAGKSSLLFDAVNQAATRTWLTPLRAGAVRFFFHPTANAANLRWSMQVLVEPPRERAPTLRIDGTELVGANLNQSFRIDAGSSWQAFAAEVSHDRLRIFVNDHCLGETPLTVKESVRGIRIAAERAAGKEPGKLWIDELSVTRRLSPLPRPQPDKEHDMLWLEHGEQLFGRIVAANADGATLDAKFGKRTLPWSKLRGIQFAQPKTLATFSDPEITFRPGPGFPVDCLRAKLVRWENSKLVVGHALFGDIAIERERLDKIRIAAK